MSHTQAGGVWFPAPGDQHHTATGTTIDGFYNNGAQLPSIHEWSLQKVE